MKRIVLLYLLPLFFVLGIVRTAKADGEPIEGHDYWILPQTQCETGTCVRIAPRININTPRLAEKLGVKPIDIRRDNPAGTIACCRIQGTKDKYRIARESGALEDRTSDIVWKSCPNPEDQYVYILPGQVIKISGVKHLSFQEEEQLKAEIKRCTTSDCATEVARKWGAKIAGGGAASAPVQGADPIVAELTACTTAECAVEVAKKAGAAIVVTPPSDGDKLLTELEACGENDACKNAALLAHGVKPVGKIVSQPSAPAKEVEQVVDFRLVAALAIATSVALLLLALWLSSRKRCADLETKLAQVDEDFSEKQHEYSVLGNERNKLRQKVESLETEKRQTKDERDGLADKMTDVYKAIREFATKNKVPLPQNLSLAQAWNLVRQHFESVASENGKLAKANTELNEVNQAVAKRAGEAEDKFNRQVVANTQMAETLVSLQQAIADAKSSLNDWELNKSRCRELFGRLNIEGAKLIAVDNELTQLYEPHQEKIRQFEALAAASDPRAADVRTEIESIESRIKELAPQSVLLTSAIEDLRQEFGALHERLAGFKLDELELYREAQRDRNDAAKVLGEAKAKETLVMAKAEKARQEIEAEKAAMESQRLEYMASLQANLDEFIARETKVEDRELKVATREVKVEEREAACRYILKPYLTALHIDAITIERLKEMGGVEGLMHRHNEAYEKLRESYAVLQRRFEELEKAQAAAPAEDAGQATQRLEILLADRDETIVRKDAQITGLTNERDSALGQVGEAQKKIAELESRVAELAVFELAAKGSFRPSPVPSDVAAEAAALDDAPQIAVRLDDPDEPVPTSLARRTIGYDNKPVDEQSRVVAIESRSGDSLVADEFFDLADQLVKSGQGVHLASIDKVRTLQLLLTEVPVCFDFDGIFRDGSEFSPRATHLIDTRGEDFIRSHLANSGSLLGGIQWLLEMCGLAEVPSPHTNRAWSPG